MLQNIIFCSIYHFHIFLCKANVVIMNHISQKTHSQVYFYSVCFMGETLHPNPFTVKRTFTPAKTLDSLLLMWVDHISQCMHALFS